MSIHYWPEDSTFVHADVTCMHPKSERGPGSQLGVDKQKTKQGAHHRHHIQIHVYGEDKE